MRFFLATSILCMALPFAASAQEPPTATGSTTSGTTVRTVQDVIEDIRALAPGRLPKRLTNVLVNEQKQRVWDEAAETERERLTDHRRDCREEIRRANRDQLMPKLLQCYRSDLLLEGNILRKQLLYVNAIPLLDPVTKASTTGSITKLADAQMTIVNAIDTGLFTSSAGLEEAKRNLRANYREPYWLGMLRLEADYELTWALFMVKNIEERVQEGDLEGPRARLLEEATLCLESGAKQLVTARSSSDRLSLAPVLSAARETLSDCRAFLKNIAKKEMDGAS